ncbi:hypothetical protein [Chitinophaga caseinilytica]|uniref:Uncharacterized protein n=1 Tax=Chitinophaga caseinilytica TaxID=2267521 RepID=A0ABZ2Z3P2_9BACT
MRSRYLLIATLILAFRASFAQSIPVKLEADRSPAWADSFVYRIKDSGYFAFPAGNCKGMRIHPVKMYELQEMLVTVVADRKRPPRPAPPPPPKRPPFLVIHGNVMYDYYYQGNTDTPYIEKDIHQHTVQTSMSVTVRDQYPLRFTFSTSQSNSRILRNMTGLNLGYSANDLRHAILQKARKWDAGRIANWKELDGMKTDIRKLQDSLLRMRTWFSAPSQIQRMIEARERELYGQQKPQIPTLPDKRILPLKGRQLPDLAGKYKGKADSAVAPLLKEYEARKAQADSLEARIAGMDAKYRARLEKLGARKESLVALLNRNASPAELISELDRMRVPDSVLPKGYKTLLSIRSAGIGRSMIDYSELTARNISIVGANVEVNPSWYAAVGIGAVDYRFRDYLVKSAGPRQFLQLYRGGYGLKEGSHVYVTYYTGRKQAYNFNLQDNPNVQVPDSRLMGVSVEGRWQLGKFYSVTGEIARSSLPQHERAKEGSNLAGSMVKLSDNSAQAYSLSAEGMLPATGTKVSGMVKRMGANFQSFSLYSTGSAQTAWMFRADQPFFKDQLTLSASVRKNVYASVFENAQFLSNTVFKSVQATFRRRNWPSVSLGYFPSSQLIKTGDHSFMENMFYTLVGTANHFYRMNGLQMNTMLSATRFYNRQSDTAFVYFNSTNLTAQQAVFLGKWHLNGLGSLVSNTEYRIYGCEGNALFKAKSWLDVGAGIKYNYQTTYRIRQLGYSANLRVEVPKVGEIALMADQGFLPGTARRLVPNKTGRATFTRTF